jgi:hypothetical protein
MIPALYKKLLALYPRGFRERLGESMEQTFHDLYKERKQQPGHGFFLLSILTETAIGIVREHLLILIEGIAMKNMLANPRSAAITSLILCLPLGLTLIAFMLEIERVAKPITALFTSNGYDLNVPGRIFIIGGLLLLPIAFALNLRPLLRKEAAEGKRRLYAINLIVGVIIVLLIAVTWGGLIMEEIYCLRGIRCD